MANKDNIFERRAKVIEAIIERRARFFGSFMGVNERPPFTHKLTRADKVAYYRSLPVQKQYELWQQMDEDERAEVRG